MTLSLLFWILLLLALLNGVWSWPEIRANWKLGGMSLLFFLLFLILGWAQFGQPIKD
jgi:hypothetical protein